jgi:DNA-binding CsgD family transcriptional regulator
LKQIPAFQRIWMEHAAEFGIDPPQIGVPMFGPHGETAIFLVHAKEAPKYDYERNKLLRKVMSRAVEFHDSVMTSYDMAAILGVPSLTEREKFCLYQAAIGQGTSVIAQLGGISDRTVETHLKTCREKLEAKTTVHAVAIAVYKGIIQPELPEEAPSALIGAPKI